MTPLMSAARDTALFIEILRSNFKGKESKRLDPHINSVFHHFHD